jgi:hypothetical protein
MTRTEPPIVQEVLAIEDIDTLLERVRDVAVACAMAHLGDAEPRGLLQHLLDLAESYQGDPDRKEWMVLVGLIDVLADEVRNSDAPADTDLVARTDALMWSSYSHFGADTHANRYIEPD